MCFILKLAIHFFGRDVDYDFKLQYLYRVLGNLRCTPFSFVDMHFLRVDVAVSFFMSSCLGCLCFLGIWCKDVLPISRLWLVYAFFWNRILKSRHFKKKFGGNMIFYLSSLSYVYCLNKDLNKYYIIA